MRELNNRLLMLRIAILLTVCISFVRVQSQTNGKNDFISAAPLKCKVYTQTILSKHISVMGSSNATLSETITDTSAMEINKLSDNKTILYGKLIGFRQKGKFIYMGKEEIIDSNKKTKKGEESQSQVFNLGPQAKQKMTFVLENGSITFQKAENKDSVTKINESTTSAMLSMN